MSGEKKRIIKLVLALVLLVAGALLQDVVIKPVSVAIFIAALAFAGLDIILRAVRNIANGQVFDENFLMSIATIGAFAIGEYPEGVAVMLFYQVGELFQNRAVNKSRKSIADLMDIRPDYANVYKDGVIEKADPYDVAVGDLIVVNPGEKVPLDAVVEEGVSTLDTSALTGESMPRNASPGDVILSGCININGRLVAKTLKEFGESTASKILDLVENASSKKSNSENFITKFARYYTPSVVIVAALLAVIPPLLGAGAFSVWIYRALTFLVISCPCALVISVPLSFFGGIGAASKRGILIKGSNYLEALAKTEVVAMDKTGTLTKGVFNVQKTNPQGISDEELLRLAAYAESASSHPISISLKKAYGKPIDPARVSNITETAGQGVIADVDGVEVAAGNAKLIKSLGIDLPSEEVTGTLVHVVSDKKYRGSVLISDEIKADAKKAVADLKAVGIKTVMLTGDAKSIGEKVAAQLGVDEALSELLPDGKVEKVEELLRNKSASGKLAFVGDGINDAPVLARADIGIAMGGLGSDAAIEAADIVVMTDEPSKLPEAIKISKKTLEIVKQNIVFALGVKLFVLVLGALGYAPMWAAVFADVGVSVLAILNAMRVLNYKSANA
ncbi:MAG: cadmium-translocating P-type ATPase [Clostridiales bacterium]|jgi:Cd2+/Zn2+-exporting ATPase|nr:cadmium-translocating P-type ATPase [Clostridiales bacterium]